MRAQEQGGEVAAKELGGWEGPGGDQGGRPADLQAASYADPIPRALLRDVYVQGGPVPRSHLPRPGRLPVSHLTQLLSPVPPACGQLYRAGVTEGKGAIALCILEKTLGKGGDPTHSWLVLCPFSALSSWLFLSRKGLQRGPHLRSPPASDSQAAFPAPKLSQHPPTLGVQLTQDAVRTHRACAGACGGQAWVFCPPCLRPRDSPDAETLSRAPASLCPETNPPSRQPTLGFQSIVRVLLFGSFFGYFPLSGGRGGRAPHAGLDTCPFPDASRAPTPPAAYVYNVQSIPPARKKELPRPVKMAGVQKEGMGASPLQSENPN